MCPPFTSTAQPNCSWIARAASRISSGSRTRRLAKAAASSRFGVTSLAKGNRRLAKMVAALGLSSGVPLLESITGSTTSDRRWRLAKRSATASMIAREYSMPVFTARIGRLPKTESSCAATTLAGVG